MNHLASLADYLRDFIVERYHEDAEDLRSALDRLADPKAALTSTQLRETLGLDG